ncbi:MAG: dTMP kinase [Armatimonadetes bacterium CG_4_10_14_3_um_filter_66_18]|nr:MAG: dTMP kinase [Armatimonadetes bacterium CG_4_8_14_3_um_filter_66_20]PIY52631.1 MAG: dTMP kinase [Armatimonadetes bacterium CG_4_10_14_3_um_filter_66_18]
MIHGDHSFFLVIEGLDGSGKSSVARWLVTVLLDTLGPNVKLTFEPHDPSCAGLFIRQALMSKIRGGVPPNTLALAFAVNRADHCDRELRPFLEGAQRSPRMLVCDRYYLSSLVYQSSPELSRDGVMDLNSAAIRPDLTIFLSASNRTCYDRLRLRQEGKELFERNLDQTRRKYQNAIQFLRGRGDKVVEVDADGAASEVLTRVIDALAPHAPRWLEIQRPLPTEPVDHVFVPTETTIQTVAEANLGSQTPRNPSDLHPLGDFVQSLRDKVTRAMWALPFDQAATLFLDGIRCKGYEVRGRLPWTDLDAFELEYAMPLGMRQHGAALVLGNTQRYDMIVKKLMADPKVKTLDRMSDFLFVFDANPSHLINTHYERDILDSGDSASLSPSLTVLTRSDLADMVTQTALRHLQRERPLAVPEPRTLKRAPEDCVPRSVFEPSWRVAA